MPVVKQYKTVRDALNGITQALAGGFGFLPGTTQGFIAALQFLHGLVQGLGALPHLFGQHHGVLESRVGLRFMGRAGFHPHDQCIANPPQALIFRLKLGNAPVPVVCLGDVSLVRNGHQAGQ